MADMLLPAEWRPGDPLFPKKPRRQHCLNAGCGTSWVAADVTECPGCGGPVGEPAVALCVLDESNDMEAFVALPDCEHCGGTGKQLPDDFGLASGKEVSS